MKKNKLMTVIKERGQIYLLIGPFLILFFLMTVLPVLSSIILSFFNFDMVSLPSFVGLENYLRMFIQDDVFPIILKNTFVLAVLTGPAGFLLSFVLAWMINEFRPGMRTLLSFMFYVPSLVGNASSKYIASSTKRYDGVIRQRYIFLTENYCDYSGMANIYRNYLLNNEILGDTLKSQNIKLHLETIGTIKDLSSTLGFVHEINLPLTRYEDNISILKKFEDKGITDISLILSSWFGGGKDQELANKVNLIKNLGGKSGYKKLIKYCGEKDISIYPTVLLNSFSKSSVLKGNKYAAVDLAYNKVELENYNMVSGEKEDTLFSKSRLVISPKYISDIAETFLGKYNSRYDTGLTLGDIASTVYSDMRKTDTYLRSSSLSMAEDVVKKFSDKTDLILASPNDVMAGYSTNYTDIPNGSSSYLCEKTSVPFYQMVFHGYSEYSSTALNITSNIDRAVLKCIEYGAVPKFSWIYNGDLIEANPQRAELYYADYKQWFDKAVIAYKQINNILSDLRGCTIIEHCEIESQVFKTVYSNGTAVYVNYNDSAVEVDGITVPALSAVKGGN